MASRFFISGGTGDWNSTTNWSDTSGGASGFSVPIAGDDVFLDANSGAGTLTVNVTSACDSFNCTGFIGTLDGSSQLSSYSNVTWGSGMTNNYTGLLRLLAVTCNYTSNGIEVYNLSLLSSNTTKC